MTSTWTDGLATQLSEAAEMTRALDLCTEDEALLLNAGVGVLRRAAAELGAEERASTGIECAASAAWVAGG